MDVRAIADSAQRLVATGGAHVIASRAFADAADALGERLPVRSGTRPWNLLAKARPGVGTSVNELVHTDVAALPIGTRDRVSSALGAAVAGADAVRVTGRSFSDAHDGMLQLIDSAERDGSISAATGSGLRSALQPIGWHTHSTDRAADVAAEAERGLRSNAQGTTATAAPIADSSRVHAVGHPDLLDDDDESEDMDEAPQRGMGRLDGYGAAARSAATKLPGLLQTLPSTVDRMLTVDTLARSTRDDTLDPFEGARAGTAWRIGSDITATGSGALDASPSRAAITG